MGFIKAVQGRLSAKGKAGRQNTGAEMLTFALNPITGMCSYTRVGYAGI